jgi:hypothetical protein
MWAVAWSFSLVIQIHRVEPVLAARMADAHSRHLHSRTVSSNQHCHRLITLVPDGVTLQPCCGQQRAKRGQHYRHYSVSEPHGVASLAQHLVWQCNSSLTAHWYPSVVTTTDYGSYER